MAKKKMYTVTLTLPDGTRKYYRGATKKEADAKRRADAQKIEQGVKVGDKTLFREFADVWFTTYKKGHLHASSEEDIQNMLRRYILPQLGDMALKDILPLHVQMMMNSIKDKSNSVQRRVLQETKAILECAQENGLIAKNPVAKSIKAEGKKADEVEPLSSEEVTELLSVTADLQYNLYAAVMLNAGLRKGEALGLMWKDIDFDEGLLHVQRSIVYTSANRKGDINPDLKTEHADRVIPMTHELWAMLSRAKKESRSLYVFPNDTGSYHTEATARTMWDRGKRRVKFHVHQHQLRHTCITNWLRQGLSVKEIQYLAGHATPEITMRIYAHYQAELEREQTAEKMRATQ